MAEATRQLRAREKAHTRDGDAIGTARRRLPMVEVGPSTPLTAAGGPVPLIDVFEGRKQQAPCHLSMAHNLAFQAVGHYYAHRLNGPRMRYDDVARRLGLQHRTKLANRSVLSRYDIVRHAFATVRRYCQAPEDTLLVKHVPEARVLRATYGPSSRSPAPLPRRSGCMTCGT
ncbi:DUF899 family protein [Actinoplanes sp. Pm04-4]|uniref:DUF899 family protein n=1 Tax=Paractinoplanes pyxinae TaxID=2997416 RepID=A0ABT4BGS2_9ACTN|nr:DUF899 family protein [Actinoplanes pyxinae]